jgi:hypothetical protein
LPFTSAFACAADFAFATTTEFAAVFDAVLAGAVFDAAFFAAVGFGSVAVFFMGEAVFFTFVDELDGAFRCTTAPGVATAAPLAGILGFCFEAAMMTTPDKVRRSAYPASASAM